MIDGISIEDRFISFSTPRNSKVGSLFKIDSVNLILGKNGAGKTELLLSMAEAITRPEYSGSRVHVSREEGRGVLDEVFKREYAAIYYSALPFRRTISRRSGFIDASPNGRARKEVDRLEHLKSVADTLGVDTSLIGEISHSPNIVANILVPLIIKYRNSMDSELAYFVDQYQDIENDNMSDRSDEADALLRKATNSICYVLEEYIQRHCSNYQRLLYLSAIEHTYRTKAKSVGIDVALSFLRYIKAFPETPFVEMHYLLQEIVEGTESIASFYFDVNQVEIIDNSISFEIPTIVDLDQIRSRETSINIKWSSLSSGLQALSDQFAAIASAIEKASDQFRENVVILIDEGDAYLHLEWQRRYLSLLNGFLGELKCKYRIKTLQLILATHSPLLAADLPSSFITNLDSSENSLTFAAPLEQLILNSFDSSAIGEFAVERINELNARAKTSSLTEEDHILIDEIGDPAIKAAFMRIINK